MFGKVLFGEALLGGKGGIICYIFCGSVMRKNDVVLLLYIEGMRCFGKG